MFRISDPERFQKIASGVQAALVSVAVVIGGGWTLYTFNSQLQVENARAQVQKLKREIEAEPKIEIAIEPRQLPTVKHGQFILAGVIAIKNTGNATTALLLEGNPVTIFRVDFDSDGMEVWTPIRRVPLRMTDTVIVGALVAHASATKSVSFATLVEEPGLFAVRFSARRQATEATAAIALAKPKGEAARIEWATHAYVVLK